MGANKVGERQREQDIEKVCVNNGRVLFTVAVWAAKLVMVTAGLDGLQLHFYVYWPKNKFSLFLPLDSQVIGCEKTVKKKKTPKFWQVGQGKIVCLCHSGIAWKFLKNYRAQNKLYNTLGIFFPFWQTHSCTGKKNPKILYSLFWAL